MADATAVTGATLVEMLTSPIAREIIAAKLRRVVIRDADQVDVRLAGDTLIVEVEAKEAIRSAVLGASSLRSVISCSWIFTRSANLRCRHGEKCPPVRLFILMWWRRPRAVANVTAIWWTVVKKERNPMSGLITGLVLLALGALAAASSIVARRPDAKAYIELMVPYQGWFGFITCLWGA